MKKLLALLLVLGISSVASAGVIDLQISSWGPGPDPVTEPIDPVREITIGPSQWVNIDIIYTGDPGVKISQLSTELILTGAASLDISDLTLPPGAWDPDPTFSIGAKLTETGATFQYGEGIAGSGSEGPILIDHILLHCDAEPGVVTLVPVELLTGGVGSLEVPTYTFAT